MKKIAFVFVAAIVASLSMSMASCGGNAEAQDSCCDSACCDSVVEEVCDTVAADTVVADTVVAE